MATKKEKNPITGGQYGQNIVLVIDGVKVSKKILEKELRTEIITLQKKYNSTFVEKDKKTILSLLNMVIDTKAKKVTASKVVNKVKKVLTTLKDFEEAKTLTKKEVSEYKKLLLNQQSNVQKIKTKASYRGEY